MRAKAHIWDLSIPPQVLIGPHCPIRGLRPERSVPIATREANP